MSLSPGSKLGPYEILSPLGTGGMGEVWKARDTRLNRTVAIKTSSKSFSERFEVEARAIAALNHPHICQIYDVGPDYIVMEYVDGPEIKGPLPLDLALKAAIQLASALEAAHRKSITHRDLKPANILTTKSGIKVLDFGLAKFELAKESVSAETITRALTQEGSIVGTLQYMAPEQLQGKATDARSDIFSFGCVLYEILTGHRAFRAENKATLIASILEHQPEALTLHQPQIPPALDRVVRKCLAKDPDDRWQTATDLKSELQWVQEGGSQAGIPAPVVEHRRRNARLGWIVAAVFAAALAAFAIFYFRNVPTPAAVTRFEVPPPEGTSWGDNDLPRLSPDGSRILFGATNGDATRALWLRRMDSVVPQLITGITSSPTGAAWSPDGLSIVYTANRELWRLDLSGGSPQRLSSKPTAGPPSWSAAGVVLFTGLRDSIYQIPASGGEAKLALAAGGAQWFPHFLPVGRHFLFGDTSKGGLYLGELDAKEGKRLADGSSGQFVEPSWVLNVRSATLVAQAFDTGSQSLSGSPITIADQVASRNGNTPLFSVSRNGVLAYRRALPPALNNLTWYDRQGKPLGTIGDRALYSNPALSPDRKRMAVSRMDPALNTRDIWVLDLARGVSSRLTFDPADETNPTWSPDGSRIAYSKRSLTGRGIFWKTASGAGAEEPLLENSDTNNLEDWSPDGKQLLLNMNNQVVAKMSLEGPRKPDPILKATFAQDHAKLSPDGRWLAYVSQETGRPEVFVQNFPPSGGKWQISSNGGNQPCWRGDGKELYFTEGARKFKAVAIKSA